jgi:hypothetical protein
MFKGLFVNTKKENCSIHESGMMVYHSLIQSKQYALSYQEVSADSRLIDLGYDFYLFNYHKDQMYWFDTGCLKTLPGKKYTIVLEVSPGKPFASVNDIDFDGYMVLDPTIPRNHPKVFPFVRPLELDVPVKIVDSMGPPIIGCFGYPTPGKGFELVIDAVNREFHDATVRINVPPVNDSTAGHTFKLFNRDYTDYLEDLCRATIRGNNKLEFTRNFYTKEELINWCAENTLNCFLYNRFQTGLSATTDQAIVTGKPLAVSTNETFRHIHQYITPYPYRSLRDSIKMSAVEVAHMKHDWTVEAFQSAFVNMLQQTECKQLASVSSTFLLARHSDHSKPNIMSRVINKLKRTVKSIIGYNLKSGSNDVQAGAANGYRLESPDKTKFRENTILIVSHSAKKCGIHEFGWNLKEALKLSEIYHVCYAECNNANELFVSVQQTNPTIIVYNYYPLTMPWLTSDIVKKYLVTQIGYVHEYDQSNLPEKIDNKFFDYVILPDPSLEIPKDKCAFKTGRLLAKYQNYFPAPTVPTIGSFGFGFPDKGFDRLITKVQEEFDDAIININMPFNDVVDPDGTKIVLPTAEKCRKLIYKAGIILNISHDYLSKAEILDFLAKNTINCFFYDSTKTQGISSVLDYAIAAQRPIAITPIPMFRHLKSIMSQVSIEQNSLKSLISNDIVPLIPFMNDWSEPRMIMTFDNIFDKILGKKSESRRTEAKPEEYRSGTQFPIVSNTDLNIILDNSARKKYKPVMNAMFAIAGGMMSRKIHEANIQQAFVLNTVLTFTSNRKDLKILSVGSFEDTAGECLKKLGYIIEEIDPAINYDLDTYFHLDTTVKNSYDIVFSTSVIEHVTDDNVFIEHISKLLKPGGKGILTCDFKPDYKIGDELPLTDLRFYTLNDLENRLLSKTSNCNLFGVPKWREGAIDFYYNGLFRYSFASFVFEKAI